MPPRTTFEQARSFGIYTAWAIMNRRGDEVVDLAQTSLRQ